MVLIDTIVPEIKQETRRDNIGRKVLLPDGIRTFSTRGFYKLLHLDLLGSSRFVRKRVGGTGPICQEETGGIVTEPNKSRRRSLDLYPYTMELDVSSLLSGRSKMFTPVGCRR